MKGIIKLKGIKIGNKFSVNLGFVFGCKVFKAWFHQRPNVLYVMLWL
jgi:hypothetical protein